MNRLLCVMWAIFRLLKSVRFSSSRETQVQQFFR